ncbi:hypothetical protein KA977_04010 [Candidatus Dependentiae bacterium]|nr:hypothetical protein [Candidatus Dependentiae bacterium]
MQANYTNQNRHTFYEWAGTIGRILEANGFNDFLTNKQECVEEFSPELQDIKCLFENYLNQVKTSKEWAAAVEELKILPQVCNSKSTGKSVALSKIFRKYLGHNFNFDDKVYTLICIPNDKQNQDLFGAVNLSDEENKLFSDKWKFKQTKLNNHKYIGKTENSPEVSTEKADEPRKLRINLGNLTHSQINTYGVEPEVSEVSEDYLYSCDNEKNCKKNFENIINADRAEKPRNVRELRENTVSNNVTQLLSTDYKPEVHPKFDQLLPEVFSDTSERMTSSKNNVNSISSTDIVTKLIEKGENYEW